MTAADQAGNEDRPASSEAVERLRLTGWQYALLAVMVGLVGAIGEISIRSNRELTDQSLTLAYDLQDILGERTDLERQIVDLSGKVDAWREGTVDADAVELSLGFVERQLRTAIDEAVDDARLQGQIDQIGSDIAAVREIVVSGPPPGGSDADRELTGLVDDALFVARQILNDREVWNFQLIVDLENEVGNAQRGIIVAAVLLLVLIGLAIVLMWHIHRTNYSKASELLDQQHRRYLAARADKDRAEELAKIQTEILELVATDRPADEVFERIIERTAEHLPGITLRFCCESDTRDRLRTGAVPMVARESTLMLGDLEWTCGVDVEPPPDFELILAFAAGLGALALDRHEAAEAMVFQATHDALTGLPNRSLFTDTVQMAIERARTDESRLAVLFIDLDRFKVINDTFGHEAGDRILIHAARCLISGVRISDTVARLAGDEFVVLMEDVGDLDQVERTAQRIQAHLQDPVEINGISMQLAACIGIAHGDGGSEVEELLRNADAAMYRAKNNGRDRFEFFDDALRDWAAHRSDLELALRSAIDNEEFEARYQPLYDTDGLRVVGFEALVRWQRPGVGLVNPGEFITVAEELGLIGRIDALMMANAARAMKEFRAIDESVYVSVNVSARDLTRPDFADRLETLLAEADADPRGLVLEITETVLVEDAEQITETLTRLRGLGVRVAIDDFGTGYSSLRYLRELPADILKIDQAFVSGSFDTELADPPIVASVIDLGHAVGLEVIAEGIETPSQLDAVRVLGADVVQGFLFSRPIADHEAIALLSGTNQAGIASATS